MGRARPVSFKQHCSTNRAPPHRAPARGARKIIPPGKIYKRGRVCYYVHDVPPAQADRAAEAAATQNTKAEGKHLKIVVIDGQGGSIGKAVVEQLKKNLPAYELTAIGTNSMASASMLKAGADNVATGENPVVVACRDADIVIGPIGIIQADALMGEITPAMALAVSACRAKKILIPISKCRIRVVGAASMGLTETIKLVCDEVRDVLAELE